MVNGGAIGLKPDRDRRCLFFLLYSLCLSFQPIQAIAFPWIHSSDRIAVERFLEILPCRNIYQGAICPLRVLLTPLNGSRIPKI